MLKGKFERPKDRREVLHGNSKEKPIHVAEGGKRRKKAGTDKAWQEQICPGSKKEKKKVAITEQKYGKHVQSTGSS